MENLVLSVSDFIAVTNQTLEFAYPSVEIEGEVASFKVNQGKFVFFDLKDSGGSIGCFMMVFALRIPIEDGMKVIVRAVPKLTKWGKFSLTIQQIRPSGEGSLKKSFELLKSKLDQEGMFALERKRPLPVMPQKIAVITSTQAAGYADFVKILDEHWGGIDVEVAHVQVQGEAAPDQMIRALRYFNEQKNVSDVIVMIRGGGSADDLAAYNDEPLVRAVAASRVPVLSGIGHEIDESLVDLAADMSASTPSNAAQILVPDKRDMQFRVSQSLMHILRQTERAAVTIDEKMTDTLKSVVKHIERRYEQTADNFSRLHSTLQAFDPEHVLRRGYALVRGDALVGKDITIETYEKQIKAEVKHVTKKR